MFKAKRELSYFALGIECGSEGLPELEAQLVASDFHIQEVHFPPEAFSILGHPSRLFHLEKAHTTLILPYTEL